MKFIFSTSAPAIKYFYYEIQASSTEEAIEKFNKLFPNDIEPYESHYELTDDENLDNVETVMAKGGRTKDEVKVLYDKADELFNSHISNGGKLDYSEKEYGYLADELEDVEVGYFKDKVVDSDYANRLREEGFTLTKQQAIDILSHRIESIKEELGSKMALGGLFGNSRYNYGRSWKLDHNRHNKRENYEIPLKRRKRFGK